MSLPRLKPEAARGLHLTWAAILRACAPCPSLNMARLLTRPRLAPALSRDRGRPLEALGSGPRLAANVQPQGSSASYLRWPSLSNILGRLFLLDESPKLNQIKQISWMNSKPGGCAVLNHEPVMHLGCALVAARPGVKRVGPSAAWLGRSAGWRAAPAGWRVALPARQRRRGRCVALPERPF